MLFSSIPFLYWFLPMTLIIYFIVPKNLKNTVLLLSSLFFYAWGEPKYVILMVISILIGWVFGLLIEKSKNKKTSKILVILSVILNLSFLLYFKYTDFFISNINSIVGTDIPLLKIALPIGISFYTFQILSYTIDVYRGDVDAQTNPLTLGAYISMFPQLIAGPIVRYSDVAKQLDSREHTANKIAQGITRFTIGLGKKVIIANTLGEICEVFNTSNDKSILFYWLYAASFALQIYFDFSGYSDMAIGLGKVLGFDFLENFKYPFISKSISEFWRRWHMSLGFWFRDYVYIPLGGSRVSKTRYICNVLIVWMLTGFWHGASWNFIVWGLYFAIFLTLERFIIGDWLKKHNRLARLYVIPVILVSFVIFNSVNIADIGTYLGGMLGLTGEEIISTEFIYYMRNYSCILTMAIIGATPIPKNIINKIKEKGDRSRGVINILECAFVIVVILIVTAYLVDGSFNPFLYFRF